MSYRLVEHFELNHEEGPRYRVVMREWAPNWVNSECPHTCKTSHPRLTQTHSSQACAAFLMLPALNAAELAAASLSMVLSMRPCTASCHDLLQACSACCEPLL